MFGCCGMNRFFGFDSLGSIGMIINLVITLLVFGGIIWLVIWAVRKVTASGRTNAVNSPFTMRESSPKIILGKRYARGEITREQYQQMLNDIQEK